VPPQNRQHQKREKKKSVSQPLTCLLSSFTPKNKNLKKKEEEDCLEDIFPLLSTKAY